MNRTTSERATRAAVRERRERAASIVRRERRDVTRAIRERDWDALAPSDRATRRAVRGERAL